MKYYLYNSECISPLYDIVDLDIMRVALSNNAMHGITGFLHRNKTHFFQYIEGPEEQVQRLLHNIYGDERHINFQVILSGDIDRPRFTGWSMGYSRDVQMGGKPVVTVNNSGEEVLAYLLEEMERQEKTLGLN